MARLPNALARPHGTDIPPLDYAISERVETAAVLLARLHASRVAQRLVEHYRCDLTTAYDYIRQARAFVAGIQQRGQAEWVNVLVERLDAACLDPASTEAGRLKAMQLLMGLLGLRRQPKGDNDDPPLYDQEE